MLNRLIAVVIVLMLAFVAVSGHAGPAGENVTGVYGVRPQCDDLSLHEYIYIESCLSGARFSETSALVLVQNGNKICGSISECAGRNCIRVDGGNLVGEVLPGKIRIFHGDGSAVDGPAPAREFVMTPRGLRVSMGRYVYYFEKRNSRLKDMATRQLCNPDLSSPPGVAAGELQAPGQLPTETHAADYFTPPIDPPARLPPTKTLTLIGTSKHAKWKDNRPHGQEAVRKLVVRNRTGAGWSLSAEHHEACAYHLRGTPSEQATIGSLDIPARSEVVLQSCRGSNWDVVKITPPKCLGGFGC